MIDRSKLTNSFEFVVTAGARARQLLAGSVPRVAAENHKKITIAQQEVMTERVRRIEKGAQGVAGGEAGAGQPVELPAEGESSHGE